MARRPVRVTDVLWHLPGVAVLAAGLVLAGFEDHSVLRAVLAVTGVAAYVVLARWAVWSWLAALAVAPAALGAGLLTLPADGGSAAPVILGGAVSLGLVAAGWRARPPIPTTVVVVLGLLAGLVARSLVGDEEPLRVSWSALSTFVLLAVPGALGLFGATGLGRSGGVPALRLICGLATIAPLVALLSTDGDAVAVLTWWPTAGALGVTALVRGRRGDETDRGQSDEVDRAALEAFVGAYGQPRLAPVAIVIAAYNEAEGLPGVVAGLPEKVCGLAAEVVVVDDGSDDGTAEAALAATRALGRGLVVACPTNRGQGAALRLGYRIAREHGAAYIVTIDADGQYDVADMAVVMRPVLDGRADFVTGSRRLGALLNRDRVRQLGTYVFAAVASVLLGRWLTDTSFGLRAMRSEVTTAVTLNQPQYQASELLVGVVSHGFSVLEVPATMHRRAAGSTKKGGNLVYGARYGRVMAGTWWREGAPRPVSETAPALRPTS